MQTMAAPLTSSAERNDSIVGCIISCILTLLIISNTNNIKAFGLFY